uniref:Uncharacterized protein n=1 Tax=Vespula pensylvanica TaxID=30213 RepID=A0A834UAE1_VESPE|nr:hypothetical protein H0235_008045 [Vespula pensylvanica]
MSYGERHACLSPLIVGNLVVCEGHTLPGHSTVENSDENMERRWFSKRAKSLKYEGIRLILNGMRLASIDVKGSSGYANRHFLGPLLRVCPMTLILDNGSEDTSLEISSEFHPLKITPYMTFSVTFRNIGVQLKSSLSPVRLTVILDNCGQDTSHDIAKSLHLNSEPPIAIAIPWQVSTLYLILLHVSSCGFTWPSWAESSTVVLTTNRSFLIEETLIEDIK